MDVEGIKKVLLEASLFQGFSEKDIDEFLDLYTYKMEDYSKNDIISLMGDPCSHLMLVVQGNAIARMVSDSGKYLQIEKIGQGRILAPAMLFATKSEFPVNVIPEGDLTLLKMSKNEFLKAMQANSNLLFNFIQIVSDINRFLSDKIHFLSLMSLKVKLAQYFLSFTELQDNDKVIEIPMGRQELADKFGVSRQSLIRTLTELEEEQLIQVNNRQIAILDREELKNI